MYFSVQFTSQLIDFWAILYILADQKVLIRIHWTHICFLTAMNCCRASEEKNYPPLAIVSAIKHPKLSFYTTVFSGVIYALFYSNYRIWRLWCEKYVNTTFENLILHVNLKQLELKAM
jgi:predicted secreted protein